MGLAVGIAVALALPAVAGASTTIGSNPMAPPNHGLQCGAATDEYGCTLVQTQLVGANVVSPISGVLTRWRVRIGAGASTAQNMRLRVVSHQLFPSLFFGAGTSAPELVPAAPAVYQFQTRLPIKANQYIGLDLSGLTPAAVVWDNPSANAVSSHPALVDGASPAGLAQFPDREFAMNAEVEPDADGDGFGDESQDQCIGSAGSDNGCSPAAPATAPTGGATGQRAAAVKRCKKKFRKGPRHKRKKCIKRAKKLPL